MRATRDDLQVVGVPVRGTTVSNSTSSWRAGLAALLVSVVGAAAYHNSFAVPLQFDDLLHITINEDDHALRVSRMKPGEQQLARLGHYVRGLDSRQAVYVDNPPFGLKPAQAFAALCALPEVK